MRLFVIFGFIIIAQATYSQTSDYSGLKLGAIIFGGYGLETHSPNLNGLGSEYYGFSGGLISQYKFEKLFLQTGITFDKRRTRDSGVILTDEGFFATGFRRSVSVINVPFMVGYSFSKNQLQPYISTGIQLGFIAKHELYAQPIDPTISQPDLPNFEFDKVEIGLLGEGGVNYFLNSKSQLQLGLRFTVSRRSNTLLNGEKDKLINSNFSIGIAYLYAF